MKTLPNIKITDDLDAQITLCMKVSGLRKADVIRQALKIGLPQFAVRFPSAPLWLEEQIREALAEPSERLTLAQFNRTMEAIAGGR